jgi:hypothetical protein
MTSLASRHHGHKFSRGPGGTAILKGKRNNEAKYVGMRERKERNDLALHSCEKNERA